LYSVSTSSDSDNCQSGQLQVKHLVLWKTVHTHASEYYRWHKHDDYKSILLW
jgi:hypothetical protein